MSWKKIVTRLGISAISLLLTLLVLEFVVLRRLDPLGIWNYTKDLGLMFQGTESDPQKGWVQKPGIYHLSASTATVTEEGRVVPDTNATATCTIATIGDSVTFGHGINDEDTWVNLLARQYQQAHFINAGVTGYNIENIQATLEDMDADGYIYLIINNDADPPLVWSQSWLSPPSRGGIEIYFLHIRFVLQVRFAQAYPSPIPPDYTAFDAHLQEILNHNVQAFVYEAGPATQHVISAFPQVAKIEAPTSYNSWADVHPDPVGNQQIAAQMLPYLSEWVMRTCAGK